MRRRNIGSSRTSVAMTRKPRYLTVGRSLYPSLFNRSAATASDKPVRISEPRSRVVRDIMTVVSRPEPRAERDGGDSCEGLLTTVAPAAPRSMAQQSAYYLRSVVPDHKGHSHEALAGNPSGGHREGELLRPLRILLGCPPTEQSTDEEEQPVIPMKGPGEAHASR